MLVGSLYLEENISEVFSVMISKILIFILMVNATGVFAQSMAGKWRDIHLLRSPKSEVEQLLGPAKNRDLNIYETDSEVVTLWYNLGFCKSEPKSVWNVPKNTVVAMLVSPKSSVEITAFIGSSIRDLEKVEDEKFRGTFIYTNKSGSMEIQTKLVDVGKEEVIYVVYSPRISDSHLKCKPH